MKTSKSSKRNKQNVRVNNHQVNKILVAAVLLILLGLVMIAQNKSLAATRTYCNNLGKTMICNEYTQDGITASTYYNQYGNTTVGNNYDKPDKTN